MRYTSDDHRRYAFRDWLRQQLADLEFYQRRGDRYLVSEFARYAASLDARVEEVSLGRYLRDENPVLPTPESCRELAKALGKHPAEVLLEAGYLSPDDFYFVPSVGATEESLDQQIEAIDSYSYIPEPIRAQMKKSLQQQQLQLAQQRPAQAPVPQKEPQKPAATEPRAAADSTTAQRDGRETAGGKRPTESQV